MTTVIVAQLLDELGQAAQIRTRAVPSRHPRGFDVETRTHVHATPCRNLRSRQADRIPINVGHNKAATIGETVHLELLGRFLWAVGELDHDVDTGPWMASVETTATYTRGSAVGTDVEVTGFGLVARTAQTNLRPVTLIRGRLSDRGSWSLPEPERTLVEHAAEALSDRRQHRPIQVRGLLDPEQEEALFYAQAAEQFYRSHPHEIPRQPAGALRHSGHVGRVIHVR